MKKTRTFSITDVNPMQKIPSHGKKTDPVATMKKKKFHFTDVDRMQKIPETDIIDLDSMQKKADPETGKIKQKKKFTVQDIHVNEGYFLAITRSMNGKRKSLLWEYMHTLSSVKQQTQMNILPRAELETLAQNIESNMTRIQDVLSVNHQALLSPERTLVLEYIGILSSRTSHQEQFTLNTVQIQTLMQDITLLRNVLPPEKYGEILGEEKGLVFEYLSEPSDVKIKKLTLIQDAVFWREFKRDMEEFADDNL